ncbi:MAG: aerobic glycerol-3-phosphate dehydrogenase [Saprospiraceae bacterium]|nr:MAG: aerobic glycerol-3-phosphate dehydrogenase [Saprospiraceae bacterium]
MNFLSSLNRAQIIRQLSTDHFDLTIIGGGITGAGIALDAASRGLKVALVEKKDFASGTSSKSTKLIHGGLRYLKQLEIGLVREVGQERAIVHKIAPHLVVPEKMLLPLIKEGSYGELGTSFGLWVYDILAGVEGDDKRKMLSREETLTKEPLLKKDIVTGGGFYAEYRTDDARLTIENIKTANQFGAICINYVEASDFEYNDEHQIEGVKCIDRNAEKSFIIRSKHVISAAGPWVDNLRKVDHSLEGKHLFLSKGVHIVVPHARFPVHQAVYFDVPDGRMIFAIPRNRVTYIGTTDTPYKGDINNIPVYREDVDYLLNAANNMFPTIMLTIEDVESSWAGLRPLIHEEGKSASEMSRKDELFISDSGLISIAGGKLTGFRKMAERVVDVVAKKTDQPLKRNRTEDIPLTGGIFADAEAVEKYRSHLAEQIKQLGLTDYHAKYLVGNYGKQSEEILLKMKDFPEEPLVALARAEAWYSIQNELVLTLMDFFVRRTGRLYFDLPSIEPIKSIILNDFKNYFQWDENRLLEEQKVLEDAIRETSTFQPSTGG